MFDWLGTKKLESKPNSSKKFSTKEGEKKVFLLRDEIKNIFELLFSRFRASEEKKLQS